MYQPIQLNKTTTLPVSNSLSWWPWRRGLLLIGLALACFALSPTVQAVNPPPDGGYPNANTAEGTNALFSLSDGFGNTALGYKALYFNTTGNYNTATGRSALYNNTTADYNTANGVNALFSNTGGTSNTANGYRALFSNTTGDYNTANGYRALYSNTTGNYNTADGADALSSNTSGSSNTANGYRALYSTTIGGGNTADGAFALFYNTTGHYNTANGFVALYYNTTGRSNTAEGVEALYNNTGGHSNTAHGRSALYFNTTGGNNIALGADAGINLTTGSNNIDIGNAGVAGESDRIRIGTQGTHQHTFIAGISGATASGGSAVFVSPNGKLGTVTSSKRFKEQITPMDKQSQAILALKPVSFRYKQELDPESIPQFGLVAEEVEKVSPNLVARDEKGKAYTVRYEAVNAMLLNEFLKEHRKVEELEAKITVLTASLKEQASQIQKVSDQIQLRKAAPRVVTNDQ